MLSATDFPEPDKPTSNTNLLMCLGLEESFTGLLRRPADSINARNGNCRRERADYRGGPAILIRRENSSNSWGRARSREFNSRDCEDREQARSHALHDPT